MTQVTYAPVVRRQVTTIAQTATVDAAHSYFGRAMTLAAAFAERDGAEVEYFNSQYWLLGGWDPVAPEWGGSDVTTNEVWSSPDLITWTKILAHDSNPPTSGAGARWRRRHTLGTASFAGYLWVIGGDTSDTGPPYPSDVWRSADGTVWERVAASSPWGYLSILGVYNGAFHLMGGTTAPTQHYTSTDGVTWTQLPDMPFGRSSVTRAVVLADKMYVAGGLDTDGTTQKNDTWRYDGTTWTRMSSTAVWSAREWVSIASYDGKLWVLTGKTGAVNGGGLYYSSDGGVTYTSLDVYPYGPSHADGITTTADGIILAAGSGNAACVFRIKVLPTDPSVTMATLPWTLWIDGATYNPVTLIVFGKASAGTSASHPLSVTSNPTQGEINGRPTIILDGVNDVLRYTDGGALADIISASAWTVSFVGKINSSTSDSATPYANPALGGDAGAYWNAASIRSSGALTAYQDDGAAKTAATTWTAGTLVLVQARFNGTSLQIRKGKGAWTTTAAGNVASVSGPLHLGASYNLAQFAGLEICEYAASNVAISDANLNLVANDMAAKWGVSV